MSGAEVFIPLVAALFNEETQAQASDDASQLAKKQASEAQARQDAFLKAIAPSDATLAPEATVPTMPTAPQGPDVASEQAAARRRIAATIGRRGRASTILTSPNETLGS